MAMMFSFPFQFTGYDVGNNIIHVSGITSTLFPSDGGQIRVERTEYVQGMCIHLYIVVLI